MRREGAMSDGTKCTVRRADAEHMINQFEEETEEMGTV